MPSPHDFPVNDDPDPVRAGIDWPLSTTPSRTLLDLESLPLGGEREPLIDQQVLRELEEDFNSPAAVHDFARDFTQSWEGKYQRLVSSVHHRDQERAHEAVLSVKVTSIMVGASRLAHLATELEHLIDDNDMDAATESLTCVEECGSETRAELLETYLR